MNKALIRSVYEKQGKKKFIEESIEKDSKKLEQLNDEAVVIGKAQEVIQQVAKETQNAFVCHISDVASTALDAVFGDDAYKLDIEFVQRRGKTEVDCSFVRNDEKADPLTAAGGGAVDVASFALRIAIWSLMKNSGRKISNTIILDEPFRFLSKDLQPLAGEMLKMISRKMGIQFIIVTHNADIIESADKVFNVTKNSNGASVVIPNDCVRRNK